MLHVMAHLKTSIIQVKTETNCLAHVLIIAIVKIKNDPNYTAYRKGWKIHPVVDNLRATTGINLHNGGGIPELERFQDHINQYKKVVYTGLNCDNIMFEVQVETSDRINLLYDDVSRHYHVIGNLIGAMVKKFVCKACGKGCRRDITHTYDQTCSDCMAISPCVQAGFRIPCNDCNRHFRSQSCFANHKMKRENKNSVCEYERFCQSCDEFIIPGKKNERGKRFCETCKTIKERRHFCYMQPLKKVLPSGDRVLYVFSDFETTQNTRYSNTARLHVPNLVCIQQYCSPCESTDNVDQECTQGGKRKHSFWEDPVGDILDYFRESRPWCNQIISITIMQRRSTCTSY
jgi:hypothetical protein